MDVILLEKIRNLGALGEKVKVKSGYARNFLVPKGKAVYATPEKIVEFEKRRAELEKIAKKTLDTALARKQKIDVLQAITIAAKAGEEGKLFGSIGTRDIAIALTNAGVEVAKSEIDLPAGLLRQLGEFEITIELHSDVTAVVKINIIPEV